MVIVLATSIKDGRAAVDRMLVKPPSVHIVTPRNLPSVRGRSTTHMFATPDFWDLPEARRANIIRCAIPALTTSYCERCKHFWAGAVAEIEARARRGGEG
ncbi:hypothetical protein [Microbacterium halotolerans]|uniref:hypothetical protein n=1 Tax=Microbacterium halotolerans TaxID=246613 RepID=UPI000E6AB442|nr:hypothetical protein [Microbacterium halotolerans]